MVVSKIKNERAFHIFLSHAKKDQKKIADKLYKELVSRGLKVYYSGADLYIGDSLAESIENGLKQSLIGIPLLTKRYFKGQWTRDEFRAMIPLKHAKKIKILPVRYKISQEEILENETLLADTFTLCIDKGVPKVVDKIIEVLQKEENISAKEKTIEKPRTLSFLQKLATLFPVLILTGILAYLGMINTLAEVQAKVDAKKIHFELVRETMVIRGLGVDSMDLHTDLNLPSTRFSQDQTEADMQASLYSYVKMKGQSALILKELHLPAHTYVSMYQDAQYLYIKAKLAEKANQGMDAQKIWGIVGNQGKEGIISATSTKIHSNDGTDNMTKLNTEFNGELFFETEKELDLVLYLGADVAQGQQVFENLSAKAISFTDVDLTDANGIEESTLQSAKILISGTSLLGQVFRLVDEELAMSDFLVPHKDDVYDIQAATLKADGISYDLYHPSAQALKAGKQIEHLHSIFPTLLDVLVGEPSKKTIFGIIAFIVTQFLLIKGYLFPKKKQEETVLKIEVT